MDPQKIIEGIYLKDFAEQNKSWVDYFLSLNEEQREECFKACFNQFTLNDLFKLKFKGLFKDEYFDSIKSIDLLNHLFELQSKTEANECELWTNIYQQEDNMRHLVENLHEMQVVLEENFKQIEYYFNNEHNNHIKLAPIYTGRMI